MQPILHPIAPVYDARSRVLVLGSFPSVRSREEGFFYAHPRNRFWPVLAAIFNTPLPESIAEKRTLLLENGIALWDVAASCSVRGSEDASIRDVQGVDLQPILETAHIERIFCNGQAAYRLYHSLLQPQAGRSATVLPSTSPANAAWSLQALTEAWRVIAL